MPKHVPTDEVRVIRSLAARGVRIGELAERFGRARNTVSKIVNRQTHANVTDDESFPLLAESDLALAGQRATIDDISMRHSSRAHIERVQRGRAARADTEPAGTVAAASPRSYREVPAVEAVLQEMADSCDLPEAPPKTSSFPWTTAHAEVAVHSYDPASDRFAVEAGRRSVPVVLLWRSTSPAAKELVRASVWSVEAKADGQLGYEPSGEVETPGEVRDRLREMSGRTGVPSVVCATVRVDVDLDTWAHTLTVQELRDVTNLID